DGRASSAVGQPASGLPVSTSVFSPLSTYIQPPATLSAVFGAPSSWSCTTVSREMPPSWGSISQVTRLSASAARSGSYPAVQPCTSLRGGSDSKPSSAHAASPIEQQP